MNLKICSESDPSTDGASNELSGSLQEKKT